MDLANGPLPSRPPTAAPAEQHAADPWGDFLRRVFLATGLTGAVGAVPVEAPGGTPVQSSDPAPLHRDGGQAPG